MNSNEPIILDIQRAAEMPEQAALQLNLVDVSVSYGSQVVVEKLDLSLHKGQIGCLLGPSGCGKTTLLRAIAGFEGITSGTIELAGQTVSAANYCLGPELRRVGMVFQDFALFPHLTVEDNVSFGLRSLSRQEKRQRVSELLNMVGLERFAKQYPHELSGGQQQRVALVRAIAPKPDILLLDEPFSGLDTGLRDQLAKDVRDLLKNYKTTAIFVTHDQHEAFALADKMGVMCQGRVLQWDSPYQLYHKPSSRFVADFVGEGCVLTAQLNEQGHLENGLGILSAEPWYIPLMDNLQSNSSETECLQTFRVLIRPDDLVFQPDSERGYPIVDKWFRGAEYLYQLQLPDQQKVLCVTPSHVDLPIGEELPVVIDMPHLVVFSDENEF